MTSGMPTRMAGWLESAWLARYLERQLDGEELAWFEAYLLDKPELVAMVEADNHLREALALPREHITQALAFAEVPKAIELRHLRAPRTPARFAMAASLALGIALGSLGLFVSLPRGESHNVIIDPTHIVFDTMRGGESAPRLERNWSDSPYVLVDVAVPPGAEHIELRMGHAKAAALSASADGFVTFLMQRSLLKDEQDIAIDYVLTGRNETLKLSLETIRSAHENHQ